MKGAGSGAVRHDDEEVMRSALASAGLEQYTHIILSADLRWSTLQVSEGLLVLECLRQAGVDSVGDRLEIIRLLRAS